MNTFGKLLAAGLALQVAQAWAVQLPATVVTTNKVGSADVEYRWNYTIDTADHTAVFNGVTDAHGNPSSPMADVEVSAYIANDVSYTVKKIAPGAFANCRGMTTVTLPPTIEEIGDYAFSNCTSLAAITIPYGVRYIGKGAFINTIVPELALPDTLLDMGGNIGVGALFNGSISISDSSHFTYSEDGVLYNRDMTKLYACPTRTEGTVAIPDTVTNICADAFFGCHRLVYLNLPENIRTIGAGAFNVNGVWPGVRAPEAAAKLASVFCNGPIPSASDDIYAGAPADLVTYAFTDDWSHVSEWKGRPVNAIDSANPPVLSYKDASGITWFYRIVDGTAEICNEDANGRPVAAISPVSTTGTSYTTKDENETSIHAYALRIPANINGYAVTRIGDHAFDGCSALPAIGIPSSVLSIGDRAFAGCTAVKAIAAADDVPFAAASGTITVPAGVTTIGYHAFEGIKAASVDLPYTITGLVGNPVAGCAFAGSLTIDANCPKYHSAGNLLYDKKTATLIAVPANYDGTTIALPTTVTTIGAEALYGCENLESVALPDGLTAISDAAFAGCVGIVNLSLPASLVRIGEKAFLDCAALARVTFAGDVPTAAEDIYAGASAVSSFARETAAGWTGNAWKGRPLVIIRTDEMSGSDTFSYTEGGITWYFRGADGIAEIYRAGQTAVASEDPITALTLPTTLGSYLVKGIGERALSGLRGITTVSVPETYEWIGDYAFADCTSLSSVTLASGVKRLGRRPFANTNLQTLEIPASVVEIDGNPVAEAALMAEVSVAETNPGFASENGLLYDKRLQTLLACPATKTTLSLPASVTAIAEDAFYGCNILSDARVTANGITWGFEIAGGKSVINNAFDATGDVTIPETLCGFPVGDITADAFNSCTGITAFASEAAALTDRNGCLYADDGATLVRVPATFVFPYTVTTIRTVASVSERTVPGLTDDGMDDTTTTSVTNAAQTTVSAVSIAGNRSFASVLDGVSAIRAFAFYGCNVFTNSIETVTNNTTGATGFITGADGNEIPFVQSTVYTIRTETVYESLLPAAGLTVDPAAFAGTNISVGGRRPATQPDAGGDIGAQPVVDASDALTLEENTSYIGWTTTEDAATGLSTLAGLLTVKTGKSRNGTLKVSGNYTAIGQKKRRISALADLATLPGLRLVKDLSKSSDKTDRTAFDALKGKVWTAALAVSDADAEPLFGGYSTLSLSAGAKGKVKVSGVLADGTKINASAQLTKDGENYLIPILVQAYAGKKGGFGACVKLDARGDLMALEAGPIVTIVQGALRSLSCACIAAGSPDAAPSGAPALDASLVDAGYDVHDAFAKWRPRYVARTGLITASATLSSASGKRTKVTVNAVSVNGTGYGAALIKKVGSWVLMIGR